MAEQEQRAALVMLLRAHGIRDRRVLNAFERMPRQDFLPPELAEAASRDSPLPIPCGQTMERPSLAAHMIEAMHIGPEHHVLEIGAGSGWLTAVLAQLAANVTSYERYGELARFAQENLNRLGVHNVSLVHGDGLSLKDETTYDRILLGASVETLPERLMQRLKDKGQLFAAIGSTSDEQSFTCFFKSEEEVKKKALFPVWLPPLEGAEARAL